jgi:hypothetical protein
MSPASIVLARMPNDGTYGPIVLDAETVVLVDFAGPAFGGEFQKTGLFTVNRNERLVASRAGSALGIMPAKDEFPSSYLARDTPETLAKLRTLFRGKGWDTIGPVDGEFEWRDYRHILGSIRCGRVAKAA